MRVCVLVFVLGCGLVAHAQAPSGVTAPAKPAANVPALDELDKALVQNIALAGQLANKDCQGLDSVKQFQTIQKDVLAKIEAKHAGFTLDMSTGSLVAKKADK